MISKRVTAPNQLGLGLNLSTKKTRKREFLEEMNRVVAWSALVALIEPHAPRARTGRPPFPVETMLRVHFLQQWFSLSRQHEYNAMKKNIYEKLCTSRASDNLRVLHPELVEGYTEDELQKIERLYDVNFSGDLRDFMLEMGRSDGGLIGDDPITFYRRRSVRQHVFFHSGMDDRFCAMKKFNLRLKGELIISVESETQYYFLLTKSGNPDLIYRYNDDCADETDPEAMTETGLSFMEYMHRVVRIYKEPGSGVVCRGEMIAI